MKLNNFNYKKINQYINYTLASVLLLILSTFSLGTAVISNAKNQKNFTNPESTLNIVLNEGTKFNEIIDKEFNNKLLNANNNFSDTYGINFLSGTSNIGGFNEKIEIQGQFDFKTIKKEFNNKLQELINKVDDLKNNGAELKSIEVEKRTAIEKKLNRVNGFELKKQRYFNNSESFIESISVVGDTKTLRNIYDFFLKNNKIKYLDFSIVKELEKEFKIKNNDTVESIVKNNLAKYKITQNQIKSISEEIIKTKQINIQDELTDQQTSSLETTLASIVESNGTIKANAFTSSGEKFGMWYKIETNGWGLQLLLNRKVIDTAINFGAGLIWSILWTPAIGVCVYIALVLYYPCVWLVRSILSAIVWNMRDYIVKDSSWLCNRGLGINLNWNGNWSKWCY